MYKKLSLRKFVWAYVKMEENKIYLFYIVWWYLGWKSPAHVIKRKSLYAVKHPWLSRLLQKFAHGGSSTCWIKICNQICSLTTPAIQALRLSSSSSDMKMYLHQISTLFNKIYYIRVIQSRRSSKYNVIFVNNKKIVWSIYRELGGCVDCWSTTATTHFSEK